MSEQTPQNSKIIRPGASRVDFSNKLQEIIADHMMSQGQMSAPKAEKVLGEIRLTLFEASLNIERQSRDLMILNSEQTHNHGPREPLHVVDGGRKH